MKPLLNAKRRLPSVVTTVVLIVGAATLGSCGGERIEKIYPNPKNDAELVLEFTQLGGAAGSQLIEVYIRSSTGREKYKVGHYNHVIDNRPYWKTVDIVNVCDLQGDPEHKKSLTIRLPSGGTRTFRVDSDCAPSVP